MTTLSASFSQDKRLALVGVVGFAAALAAASQIAIPIPGTPVPITLQPFVVALTGLMLGPVYGAMSMLLYITVGITGVPVWAPIGAPGIARLFGPTGGYIIGYPFAAFVAGALGQRWQSLNGRWAAATLGIATLFLFGLTQLAVLSGGIGNAVALGLTPFALLDVVKAFAAALIARPARPTPSKSPAA
jgi:biotin transport system substrate-specific component